MAYNSLIPQATDRLRDSQPAILENFTVINRAFNINHVSFDTPTNEGKHKWVSFPEQAADPTTAVNEVAIFAKESALTGETELFLRQENNGSTYEWTSAQLATEGWMRSPSGIITKWGRVNAVPAGVQTITFPTSIVVPAIPPFLNIYAVIVSTYNGSANRVCRLVSYTTTTFDVYSSDNAAGCTYIAIGSD